MASAVTIGFAITTNGLGDFDTCWLLATGRLMTESHSFPSIDPFSYTFASLGRPFVMHQWLSEIVFYLTYKLASLSGLLCISSILASFAYLALPLKFASRATSNNLLLYFMVALAPIASLTRFLVRPELFSYLFISIWFILIDNLRRCPTEGSSKWRIIAGLGVLMILWANMHSSFVLGIALLAYFNAENLLEYFLLSKSENQPFKFAPVMALFTTLVASLINPYGLKLWTYVFGMFASPSKGYISEMMPIGSANLAEPSLWPFLVFLGLCVANVVSLCSEVVPADALDSVASNEQVQIFSYARYLLQRKFAIALVALSILMAFNSRRFVSVCVLTALFQLIAANSYGRAEHIKVNEGVENEEEEAKNAEEEAEAESGINFERVNACLKKLKISTLTFQLLITFVAFLTTAAVIPHAAVALPQTVSALKPPFAALKYISEHKPEGNLLNDPHFGSMLIWYQPFQTRVFIDTRYDMYEFDFLKAFGEGIVGHNYQVLLDHYNISWVFLKPFAPLVNILSQDSAWTETYRDDAAVIFRRKYSPRSSH